tara:strand:+ start:488 stop:655 length:168 start_codon:yes stop_codon:yes gene_type:complete
MEETNATRIKELIIDLTDNLKTEEELWNAYKIINTGLRYLSAKHTMEQVKEESNE